MEKITINEIRPGDKIRAEINYFEYSAVEYTAQYIGHSPYSFLDTTYYLMERPYVPKYGDVIGDPLKGAYRAVYLPEDDSDSVPWMTSVGDIIGESWVSAEWAQEQLSEGWVLIEKPEGV